MLWAELVELLQGFRLSGLGFRVWVLVFEGSRASGLGMHALWFVGGGGGKLVVLVFLC